jgi:hypothetical protein
MWPALDQQVRRRTERLGLIAASSTHYREAYSGTKINRNYPGYSYIFPLMLWSDLATKRLEVMQASAQVIGPGSGASTLGQGGGIWGGTSGAVWVAAGANVSAIGGDLITLRRVTRRISAGLQSRIRGPQVPAPRETIAVAPPKS